VKLKTLARRNAQGAVGVALRQIIVRQILLGCQDAAGHARAQHKGVGLFSSARNFALITVILLIETMKLQQLLTAFIEVVSRVMQLFRQRSTQVMAGGFDGFYAAGRVGFWARSHGTAPC